MKKGLFFIVTILVLGLFSITSLAVSNDGKEKSSEENVTATSDDEAKSNESENVSKETTGDYSSHKPSNQEMADLDIPVSVSNASVMSQQQDPEILISGSGGIKNASAWFQTDENPILVSESTYQAGINVDEMVNEAKSWHPSETVEVIDFKGNPTVVNNSGDGVYEIHIITSDKLFTLGGAEKDVLLSIAEQINFN